MSLLAISNTALFIADSGAFKRSTLGLKRIRLDTKPRAIAWSSDNSTFFIASADTIYSFLSSSPSTEGTVIYAAPQGQTLQPTLLCRDTSTVIFAQGPSVHLLSLGAKPKVSNTLIGHSSPIISLSLSNDGSLLASASLSGTLCIHNLNHNSLTLLKGLPITSNSSKKLVCAFHSHNRTRVLVGCGRVFAIYDVTRPSNPVKTIKFSEIPANSFIIAIASSPFSKPLLAVAFSSGLVALVDLEKDRSLLKVLDVNIPITAMDFTLDGTAIALGTRSGKIIVKGWRSVEDDDQIITLDENGDEERVIALSIQRRNKLPKHPFEPNTASLTTSKLSRPLAELKNTTLPNRRVDSRSPVQSGSQTSKMDVTRTTSPALCVTLKTGEPKDRATKPSPEVDVHMKEPSKPTHPQMSSTENEAPSFLRNQANSRPVSQTRTNTTLATKPYHRIEAINSRVAGEADSKSSSLDLRRQIKEPPSIDSLKTHGVYQSTSVADSGDNQVESRLKLALKELPPEPDRSKNSGFQMTQAGGILTTLAETKDKQVGWIVGETDTHYKQPMTLTESSFDEVSDEGPILGITPEICQTGISETSLHRLVMEKLNECRSELREDIKGLHLDVLRMGRAWKSELRLLMDQHARDLKALAEENSQLKMENEGLRRRL